MVWCAATLWAQSASGKPRETYTKELARRGLSPTRRVRSESAPLTAVKSRSASPESSGADASALSPEQIREHELLRKREQKLRNERLRNFSSRYDETPCGRQPTPRTAQRKGYPQRPTTPKPPTHLPDLFDDRGVSRKKVFGAASDKTLRSILPRADETDPSKTMRDVKESFKAIHRSRSNSPDSPYRRGQSPYDDEEGGVDGNSGSLRSRSPYRARPRGPNERIPATSPEGNSPNRRSPIHFEPNMIEERKEKHRNEVWERFTTSRNDRLESLREKERKHTVHTKEVIARHEANIEAKQDAAKAEIVRKAKRLLDPIDQCENQEELVDLQAATYLTIIPHVLLIRKVRDLLVKQLMIRRLAIVLVPIFKLKMAKRIRLARAYAGMWRGKLRRLTIDQMRESFPNVAMWPEKHIEALMRGMKPVAYRPGETIAFQGQPSTSAFFLTNGQVIIQQRTGGKPNYVNTNLGRRGPIYVHGDEALVKSRATRHFVMLIADGPVYGWQLSRKLFMSLVTTLPMANQLAQGASVNQGVAIQVSQVIDNRSLRFWDQEELDNLLANAKLQSYDRHETLFNYGDPAKSCFIVWRGTVELTSPLQTGTAARLSRKSTAASLSSVAITRMQNDVKNNEAGSPRGMKRQVSTVSSGSGSNSVSPRGMRRAVSFRSSGGGGREDFGSTNDLKRSDSSLTDSQQVSSGHMTKSYVNAGQLFGEEGVIFNTHRYSSAVAATDCAVYVLPGNDFINGLFTNPHEFYELKATMNRQRAARFVSKPAVSTLSMYMPQPIAQVFQKNMTASVISCGEQYPLDTYMCYLQTGSVKLIYGEENHIYQAPCLIAIPEVFNMLELQFQCFLATGEVPIVVNGQVISPLPTVEERRVGPTAAKKRDLSRITTAATAGNAAQGAALLSNREREARLKDLPEFPGVQIAHRTLSRCDAWLIKYQDILRRVRGVTKINDIAAPHTIPPHLLQKPAKA